jgi:hypothetical protein
MVQSAEFDKLPDRLSLGGETSAPLLSNTFTQMADTGDVSGEFEEGNLSACGHDPTLSVGNPD